VEVVEAEMTDAVEANEALDAMEGVEAVEAVEAVVDARKALGIFALPILDGRWCGGAFGGTMQSQAQIEDGGQRRCSKVGEGLTYTFRRVN